MVCGARGCRELARYLRIFVLKDGRRIKFNLCEECNKIDWHTIGDGQGIIPLDGNQPSTEGFSTSLNSGEGKFIRVDEKGHPV